MRPNRKDEQYYLRQIGELEAAKTQILNQLESHRMTILNQKAMIDEKDGRIRQLETAATDLGNLLASWHNEYQKTKPAQLASQTTATIQRVRGLFEAKVPEAEGT